MSRSAKVWRRVERALLGGAMVLLARVVERRITRAVGRRATPLT